MSKNKENKIETLDGGVTPGQISMWKAEHKSVFQIDVDLEGAKVTGYFKKPTLDTIAAASKFADEPLKFGSIMFNNCYLGGDPEIKDNEEVRLACQIRIGELFKVRTASIKEL